MSEAMHGEPHSKPTADVVSILRTDHEIIDFSQVGPEIAVSYLFSELRHPTYSNKSGQDLAESIVKLTTVKPDSDSASHEGRLAELIRASVDDELWDRKSEKDEVFILIEEILRTAQTREYGEQRNALLRLYNLRTSFDELETAHDDQWIDVIERLFS